MPRASPVTASGLVITVFAVGAVMRITSLVVPTAGACVFCHAKKPPPKTIITQTIHTKSLFMIRGIVYFNNSKGRIARIDTYTTHIS